jgi:hypothetical protein
MNKGFARSEGGATPSGLDLLKAEMAEIKLRSASLSGRGARERLGAVMYSTVSEDIDKWFENVTISPPHVRDGHAPKAITGDNWNRYWTTNGTVLNAATIMTVLAAGNAVVEAPNSFSEMQVHTPAGIAAPHTSLLPHHLPTAISAIPEGEQLYKKSPEKFRTEKKVSATKIDEIQKFQSSPKLVTAWLEGLNASITEVGGEAIDVSFALVGGAYFEELNRAIDKVLSNFGKFKSYDNTKYHLTFGKRLMPSIESLFAEHLFLPPRQAVDFLDELTALLYSQSSENAVFRGKWGKLIVDQKGELLFELKKRRKRTIAQVLKA